MRSTDSTIESQARGLHAPRRAGHGLRARGFTLIELLVVLAIVGLLLSVAVPRYFHSVQKARENTLRSSLQVMRDAIDKFAGDQGRYPDSMNELVTRRYLRAIPKDPITGSAESWQVVQPPADSMLAGAVTDVKSGAAGDGADGTAYDSW
jgi:prepilin-type N-terminal cleavage/methylation domain-containing protein